MTSTDHPVTYEELARARKLLLDMHWAGTIDYDTFLLLTNLCARVEGWRLSTSDLNL